MPDLENDSEPDEIRPESEGDPDSDADDEPEGTVLRVGGGDRRAEGLAEGDADRAVHAALPRCVPKQRLAERASIVDPGRIDGNRCRCAGVLLVCHACA